MSEAGSLFTDGAAYERSMGRWSRPVGDQFLSWLALPMGLRWLDVGCGNGAFTEAVIVHSAPASVTGIDPSEGQLGFARSRPGTKMAQFQIGEADALPFGDDAFDVATMALVVVFLPDPAQAVAELKRVVRPGGTVATYMWDMAGGGFPLEPMSAALRSLNMSPLSPPSYDVSRRENLKALWDQAGLRSVETQVIRAQVSYAGFDDFWDSSTASSGPSARRIREMPPAAREQLKERVREHLPASRNGRIAYEAFANAVKGRVPD